MTSFQSTDMYQFRVIQDRNFNFCQLRQLSLRFRLREGGRFGLLNDFEIISFSRANTDLIIFPGRLLWGGMGSQVGSSCSKGRSVWRPGCSTVANTITSWCRQFISCLISMPVKGLWCLMSTLIFLVSCSNSSSTNGQCTHCAKRFVRFFVSFFFIFRNALTITFTWFMKFKVTKIRPVCLNS